MIPTIGAPELRAAVLSALAQTVQVHEVIVAADTADELDLPEDPRVTIVRVGPRAGGNVARQAGVTRATGELVALLDDDDAWLPAKLERQLAAVGTNDVSPWISTCRVIRRAQGSDDLQLPTRAHSPGQGLADYLFRKETPWSDHGFIQASTLLFPRQLAIDVPFDTSLAFHQDISWLLDVFERYPDCALLQVWEPLAIYNSRPGSVSKRIDPEGSIAWAAGRLGRLDPRIMGDFILTQSLGFARRTGSARAMLRVIRRSRQVARPGIAAIAYALLATAKTAVARAPRPVSTSSSSNGA